MTRMSIDAEVGNLVHQMMWQRRITQTAMAPALGIKQSAVSKKLRGLVPWTVADLAAAARVLGVSLRDLIPELSDTPDGGPSTNPRPKDYNVAGSKRVRIVPDSGPFRLAYYMPDTLTA